MAKALAIGASIAAIAAVTVVTGGAALGLGVALSTSAFGVSAGSLLAASAVLSTGSSLLAPKPKAPSALSQADRLNVSINLREPRKIAFGTTALATDLRDQEWTADQTYLHRFIVLASHRINAVREIWFDDKLAWTAAGGAQGEYARWLQVTPVLEGSAANAINVGPRMGGSRRFTGCAYVHLRYQILAHSKKLDSVFNQSVPSRVTIVGDGASVYDPRRDSTVPGGSGPQRAHDQSTWEWNASASRNPALCTLFYLLGWRINGKLAVGKGIPPARIDLASFIEAANLCDEPVAMAAGGTEPRYRCDGVISEGDDTQAVLENLKATMNAVIDDVDGRLRVSVLHNDLAAPIGDLFTGDVLGAFTWQQTLPLNDSVSVIRGSFTDPSPASLYQNPDYPEVRIASRDGIERSQTVNYPLVQSASQAQRLSKQRVQRMLYGGTFTAVFQSTAWKFQKGDVIRLSFRPLGWDRKLFRIADMATQVDGKVPMMLREEHAAIYAWDASDAAPVTGAEPTRYDPSLWPLVQGIEQAGTTADWDKVADPTNTKPEDNATFGAPDGSKVGNRPVSDVLAAIDFAKARQDELETVAIPAINKAVDDADDRITFVRGLADGAYDHADKAIADAEKVNRRVDQLIEEGGGGSEGVDSVARAEIKRVDEAAISREGAITRSIDEFDASYESGAGNLLSNTDFPTDDLAGWTAQAYLMPIAAFHRDLAGDLWQPIGESVLGIRQIGRVGDPTSYADAESDFFAVTPNSFIQFYHFAASHRCNTQLWINYYDTNGGYVTSAGGTTAERRSGGRNPDGWARNGRVCEQVPGNAVTARLIMRKLDTDPGEYDSYAWSWRPYVGPARQGQNSWNPYSVGNGKAVARAVNSRVTREVATLAEKDVALAQETTKVEARLNGNISSSASDLTRAYTDADRALGSRTSSLEASAAGPRSSMNPNPDFNAWSNPDTTPDGWVYWNVVDKVSRIPAPFNRGGFAVRQSPTNSNSGIVSGDIFVPAGLYFMEVTAYKVSGLWRGAGVTLSGQASVHLSTTPDTAGAVGEVGNTFRTWSVPVMVKEGTPVPPGYKNWHCMSNWDGFNSGFNEKDIWWIESRLRRASGAEADVDGVAARISKAENVIADLPNRYSAATRTDTLEAQVNLGTDSGLKRVLSTQIEDRATAIADEKAGAVGQTVSQLRAEYNQTKADLSVVGSVASDAYGRSRAFLQQKAVAGNNRAQLTLYADSNGGAGVDIIGDVAISGDLLVNGTIRARTFDRSSMSREGATAWAGSATPSEGQTINLPGLGLPTIPPQGRFFYEVRATIETNAGRTESTSINGQPANLTYVDDGGFLIRAIDNQGNHYVPRLNASTNGVVVATSDFNPNFAVTVSRGNTDTGWIQDGDYYHREVSATYTVRSYELRVTWIAI